MLAPSSSVSSWANSVWPCRSPCSRDRVPRALFPGCCMPKNLGRLSRTARFRWPFCRVIRPTPTPSCLLWRCILNVPHYVPPRSRFVTPAMPDLWIPLLGEQLMRRELPSRSSTSGGLRLERLHPSLSCRIPSRRTLLSSRSRCTHASRSRRAPCQSRPKGGFPASLISHVVRPLRRSPSRACRATQRREC